MPETTIKYSDSKILKVLKALSGYMDFIFSPPKNEKKSLIEKYNLSHGLALPGSFIATTAIASNLELYTYNIKDYIFIKERSLYKP